MNPSIIVRQQDQGSISYIINLHTDNMDNDAENIVIYMPKLWLHPPCPIGAMLGESNEWVLGLC